MIFHKLITSVFETGKLKWASPQEDVHKGLYATEVPSGKHAADTFKLKHPPKGQGFSSEVLYEHWMEQAAQAEVAQAYNQALIAYRQAADIKRNDPEPYLEALRVCEQALQHPDMALEWLQLALQECPMTLTLLEHWCRFCMTHHKFDLAERAIRQAKSLLKESMVEITFLQAQVYQARGILGEALQWFQYVIREASKKPDVVPEKSALIIESHMQCAQIYLELGNTDAGLRELQYLRKLNPNHLHVLQNLIYALLSHHYPKEAAHVAREALQVFPDTPILHYFLAQALEEEGRLDLAVANYLHAKRLDDEDPLYLLGLCFALRKMSRIHEALEYLEVSHRKDPKNTAFYYPLGILYLQCKQLERAEHFLELALKHHIEVAQVRPLLAMIWQQNPMKAKQALVVLQQALQQDPHNRDVLHQLGQFYATAKQWPQAQIFLEKAYRLNPEDTTLRYDLAMCYIDQKLYPKALQLLKHAHQKQKLDLKTHLLLVSLCLQLKTELAYAREALAKLVVEYPVNPQVLILQGELALREGAFETVDAIARRLMLLPQDAIIEGHWLLGQKFFQMALQAQASPEQKEVWMNEAKKAWEWVLERYPKHEPSWESYLLVALHLVNGQWVHYLRTLEWLIERYAHQQPEVLHILKRQAKKALSGFNLEKHHPQVDTLAS